MRYLALIILLLPAAALNAGEDGALRAGNRAYDKERYGEAFDLYDQAAKQGAGRQAVYNSAAALYRLKDYEGSLAAYSSVAEEGGALAQSAVFNAGDAAYMKGDLDGAARKFRQAVLMDLKDEAAAHNLQFVLQEKDKNKREQEQKQGDNKDKDNSPENSDKQQNGGSPQSQNSRPPQQQEQKLSKEEADNILQQVKDQGKAPPPPPGGQDAAASAPQGKDW